jgi:hypothetical protein
MTFSAETAVALWQAKRGTNLVRLARLIGEDTQIPDLVRDVALDIVQQHYRPLLSRLATYLMEASDSLDDKLTWENIRNDSLRAWLERNDDVAETLVPFIKGINDLAVVIEEDANSLQGREADDVAADVALDLLGAGRGFRFFRRERGRLRDRPLVEPPNGGENLPRLITEKEQADEEALALIETLRSELTALQNELHTEKTLRQEAEALLEAIEQAGVEDESPEPVEESDDPLAPVEEEEGEEAAEPVAEPAAEPEPVAAMSVGERAKRLSKIDYPSTSTAKRRSRRQRKRR